MVINKYISATLILSIISIVFLLPVHDSSAAHSATTQFGGRIYYVQYCTCSFNLLLYVGQPRGGTFIYQPGVSMLYMFYQVFRSGPWVLGNSTGTGECWIYWGEGCAMVGTGKIILKIGTSLY